MRKKCKNKTYQKKGSKVYINFLKSIHINRRKQKSALGSKERQRLTQQYTMWYIKCGEQAKSDSERKIYY